jgi:hypothetical protein
VTMEAYLSTLFDPEDSTCFTQSPNGTEIGWQPLTTDLFLAINALDPAADRAPTQAWHRADRPRRADANVTKLRSFLLELDSLPICEQRPYMDSLKVPYSAVVFSGSKSLHFLLVLSSPVPTYEAYMDISRRLHRLVEKADHSSKNPSRLSRLPFRTRPDTGKEQELVYLGKRIELADLECILPARETRAARPRSPEEKKILISPILRQAVADPETVMEKLNINGRNQMAYWMYCRFQELNLEHDKRQKYIDQFYANLRDKSGFSYEECLFAARLKGG